MSSQRRLAWITKWMPPGTNAVTVGVLVNGLATYVFLVWPARSGLLNPSEFAVVSSLWFAVYFVGPGLFIPLEQEVGRQTAHEHALQTGRTTSLSAGLVLVGGATMLCAVVGLIVAGPLADSLFEGQRATVMVLVAAIGATGLLQWAKALFAGTQDFARYGLVIALEGVTRASGVALLILLGVSSPVLYTVPVAVAPALAALAVVAWTRSASPKLAKPGLPDVVSLAGATGTLAVAQLGAQFLMNGVPLCAALLAGAGEQDFVGRIGAAVVLARIPLFFFQAIQASLLPGLSALAAEGRWDEFRSRVVAVLSGLAVLGVAAVCIGGLLGPFVLRLVFGSEFVASSAQFAALAASAILIVLALTAAQSLIALQAHRLVAAGWLTGAAAFIGFVLVATAADASLETTVLGAGIVGPLLSFVSLAHILKRHGFKAAQQ